MPLAKQVKLFSRDFNALTHEHRLVIGLVFTLRIQICQNRAFGQNLKIIIASEKLSGQFKAN